MKKAEGFFNVVTLALTKFASIVFVAVLVCVAANVIGRTLSIFTISGVIEIVQYGMLTAMSVAIVRTAYEDRHVRVTLFTGMMSKPVRSRFLFVEGLISASVFGAAGYQFVKLMPNTINMNRVTDVFRIPYVFVYVVLSIGLFLSAVVYVYAGIAAFGPEKKKAGGAGDAKEAEQ